MTDETPGIPEKIAFHYRHVDNYRDFPADGVFGGITPRGKIHLKFYIEHKPFPQKTVHSVNADGTIGLERLDEREQQDGIVRILQFGVMMDAEAAKQFNEWLGKRLQELEIASQEEGPIGGGQ